MSLAGIEAALHDKLKSVIASFTPVPPVAWPNKSYQPVVGTSFLMPRFFPNDSDWGELGQRLTRHRGLYQVTVRGPIDSGNKDAAVADNIIAGFKAAVCELGGVRVRIGSFDGTPGVPYRQGAFEDGSWNLTPVTIPWWSDET